jgi:hypothetical protein
MLSPTCARSARFARQRLCMLRAAKFLAPVVYTRRTVVPRRARAARTRRTFLRSSTGIFDPAKNFVGPSEGVYYYPPHFMHTLIKYERLHECTKPELVLYAQQLH